MKIVIGIGCDRGTPVETLETALQNALKLIGHQHKHIQCFATIDRKADEEGINALVRRLGKNVIHYPARQLAQVKVSHPSRVMRKYVDMPTVAEAAAILAAHTTMSDLLVEKLKYCGKDGKNATISIVKKNRINKLIL